MALASISLVNIKSINLSSSCSSSSCVRINPPSIVCQLHKPNENHKNEQKKWKTVLSTALAAAVITFSSDMSALADLNKFEAETRGEFGIGSAAQYGSADLRKAVHTNENFRRANFTSADMRESDFSGSTFNGAYLEKAVAYKANFTGADLSDTLMDRMVLNEANLTNAVLARTVLTRSDLGGAVIEGADFSDAVLDLPQKQALCKYASGTNPITGVSTRTSLGCGNSRRNAYGSPSSPLLSAPPRNCLIEMGSVTKALASVMLNSFPLINVVMYLLASQIYRKNIICLCTMFFLIINYTTHFGAGLEVDLIRAPIIPYMKTIGVDYITHKYELLHK